MLSLLMPFCFWFEVMRIRGRQFDLQLQSLLDALTYCLSYP